MFRTRLCSGHSCFTKKIWGAECIASYKKWPRHHVGQVQACSSAPNQDTFPILLHWLSSVSGFSETQTMSGSGHKLGGHLERGNSSW